MELLPPRKYIATHTRTHTNFIYSIEFLPMQVFFTVLYVFRKLLITLYHHFQYLKIETMLQSNYPYHMKYKEERKTLA